MLRFAVVTTLLLALPHAVTGSDSPEALAVGAFSRGEGDAVPAEWTLLPFRKIERRTEYTMTEDDGTAVVKAVSRASAAGLIRTIRIDPDEYPILEWRWKVSSLLEASDPTRKEGDDYPARIYVNFEYDPSRVGLLERAKFEAARLYYGEYPPTAALTYIWARETAEGAVLASPYTARARMIVVESGPERVGQWVHERRDVLADYEKAFGGDPPMISAVGLMTDTDNTGEAVTAWYGDIFFRKAR